MKAWLWLSIALLLWCAGGSRAMAQDDVAVLGVRTQDGDVELERRLTLALRLSAQQVKSWRVSDRELTLAQMTLAHGCDEADTRCLIEIARTLSVERLIYGSAFEDRRGNRMMIHSFDARTERLESAVVQQIKGRQLTGDPIDVDNIILVLRRFANEAVPPPMPTVGELRIRGSQPGWSVFVDGTPYGVLDENGLLVLELPPGRHFVLATGPTPEASEEHFAAVSAGGSAEILLAQVVPEVVPAPSELSLDELGEQPEPPAPPQQKQSSLRRPLGWAAVGVSAGMVVATIAVWARMEKLNNDRDYLAYRNAFPRKNLQGGVSDVCIEAERGTLAQRDPSQARREQRARTLCGQGDRLHALQYVFLGAAALAGGTGAYLLFTSKRDGGAEVTLAPSFDLDGACLETRVRF